MKKKGHMLNEKTMEEARKKAVANVDWISKNLDSISEVLKVV